MESYHLPTLHRATIGPASKMEEMDCPPGFDTFNYHWITKDASLSIGNVRIPTTPSLNRLAARRSRGSCRSIRRSFFLLTPGIFSGTCPCRHVASARGTSCSPHGLAPEFIRDPQGPQRMTALKTLLDKVNDEDRRGVEGRFPQRACTAREPSHLSYLERPNYDFARYLARQLSAQNSGANLSSAGPSPIVTAGRGPAIHVFLAYQMSRSCIDISQHQRNT